MDKRLLQPVLQVINVVLDAFDSLSNLCAQRFGVGVGVGVGVRTQLALHLQIIDGVPPLPQPGLLWVSVS